MDSRVSDQRRQRAQRRRERRGARGRRRWRRRRPRRYDRRGRSWSAASAHAGEPAQLQFARAAGRRRTVSGLATRLARADATPSEIRPRRAARRPLAPAEQGQSSGGREPELAVVGGAAEASHRRVEARRLGLGDRRVDGSVDRLGLAQTIAPSGDDMSRRLGAVIAIAAAALALAFSVYVFVSDFPAALVVLVCVFAALRSPGSACCGAALRRLIWARLRRSAARHRDRGSALRRQRPRADRRRGRSRGRPRRRPRRLSQPNSSLPHAAPPQSSRFSSSTRARATAGLPRSTWRRRRARGASRRLNWARATTWSAWSARRSAEAPTAWRWPAAMARRRLWRRSPPSTTSPMPVFRRAPATTSRSTLASTAKTSSAPSTPSSTVASAWSTSARSTVESSSTTSRSASMRAR